MGRRAYVAWECDLLAAVGFGLDLARCAVTGTNQDLAYVSPRTGRAVSREAGAPYKDKLLPLPDFCGSRMCRPTPADIVAGLTLTGHFLRHHVLEPQGGGCPRRASGFSTHAASRRFGYVHVMILPLTERGLIGMSDTAIVGEIRDVDFADALGERYLSYALSTIMARSLPDVRDGLKPVHRRILHAMHSCGSIPSGYKKCARVVGDVIGKFHPHGELALRGAGPAGAGFRQRYPLVDGRAISAISTAITRRRCVTLRAAVGSRTGDAPRHRRGHGRFPHDL